MEVNTTVFMTYLVFYTAEDVCKVSGILAIVAMGLWMSQVGKTAISPHSMHSIHSVWAYLGFVAETLIFFLAGLIVGQRYHDDTFKVIFPEGEDFGKIVACYIFCNIIRFVLIAILWPCLSRVGFKMDFAEVLMCSYSGLRGAVGLTLALIVANSTTIEHYTREVVLYYTAGIALLTLIINATTVGALVKFLGLSD
jgi:NhaP-type Na+/H+ or K+/H+ antiporter